MNAYLDRRPTPERRFARFLVFGLAVVLGVGTLTARLFYLQITNGTEYSAISTRQRTVLEPIPAPRGYIYDRAGRLLVKNVPTFTVKIRPSDLPNTMRDQVVTRLSSLLNMDPADINTAIDGNPGSAFDLVRVAQDVDRKTAQLISEAGYDLPGVEVVVEARREYTVGPLLSQILGYTGPVSPEQIADLRAKGYQPDDLIGKVGLEAQYEKELRGTYGAQSVARDRTGQRTQVLQTEQEAIPGASLRLTIDTKVQQEAQKALTWAMDKVGMTRGVVIAMNPQTGEVLAMVSLPTYDNNQFARGISAKEYQKLLKNKDKPLLNHAIQAHYAPGSTYKLVAGTGGLADRDITPSTRVITKGYLTLGSTKFYEWNHRGWGPCDIYCGFGHSSDTFFYQVAGMLGIDRLAYWARQYGFGAPTGIDLPGEVGGIVPDNAWKQDVLGARIFPGETYQAGIGQGYDAVTPLQLINAYAALANGGTLYQPQLVREIVGPDGNVIRPFAKKVLHKLKAKPDVLRVMRNAARSTVTLRHTYNLVDLPIKVAGKSGTAEFGTPDAKGRLPYSSFFVGFTPKDPRNGSFDAHDSQLIVMAFAYDSRTKGNAATEIVKYFFQLHYGIKHDYRLPALLQRTNFYSND
ncbi:MAG TPA: penicillin-binding protein 2 [Candidatus Limnocylindrales bacterium]|nr:penicillin-binding protein 2 [Candidatus Limnocylindrales bacterium]